METQVKEVKVLSNTLVDIESKLDGMKPLALLKETRKVSENWAKASFELGALLYRIKQGIHAGNKNFKYETFPEYVAAELTIKEAHANNFIRVYREFTGKGIPLDKVAGLPFSSLIAAVPYLTADNVDTEVPKLAGMSYKMITSLPEVQAAKNQNKAKGGAASAASKKAKGAHVDHAPLPKKPATAADAETAVVLANIYETVDFDEMVAHVSDDQLTALIKAIPVDRLVSALTASGKVKGKLVASRGKVKPVPETQAA